MSHIKDEIHRTWWQRLVPGFFRKDILRKVLALIFAILTYHLVYNKIGLEEKIANVPVQLDLPANLVNLNGKPTAVTVTVKGSSSSLSGLSAADLKIKAAVVESKFIPGAPYLLRLSTDNIKPPRGITIRDIEPKELMLSLENNGTKKVAVDVKFEGLRNLPKDYVIGKVRVNPGLVWISGAQSIIRDMDTAATAPIPLDSQTVESFEYQTAIAAPDTVTISPAKVLVQVEVIRDVAERTFKSVPIRLLEYPELKEAFAVEFQSSPNADITLSGPKSKIALLKPDVIKPYLDIPRPEESGSYSAEVYCWVNDPEIKVQSIYPEKVKITIAKIKTNEIKK